MSDQRLFISHANEDEAVVHRIVAHLEARGVPCWIAGRDIPPRAIYAEAITSGIQESAACGVIVSRAANASAAIKRELELASHYGRPFIPIRVDDTEPGPGLDYYLRNTQWINFGRDGNAALDRIVSHMAGDSPTSAAPRQQVYAPPPAAAPTNNIGRVAMIAVAALVLLGGGWFAWSNLRGQDTQFDETAESAAPSETTTTAVESDAQRNERERLQRERDDAFQAVNAAQQQLATELAQREAADRAQLEAQQRQAAERAAQALTGAWSGDVTWLTGGSGSGVASFTFYADGTFSSNGQGGGAADTWNQNGADVTWRFRASDSTMGASYTGRVNGRVLSGTMRTDDGSWSGTFSLRRD